MGCCFSQPDTSAEFREPTTQITTNNHDSPVIVPQYNEQPQIQPQPLSTSQDHIIERKEPMTSEFIDDSVMNDKKSNHSQELLIKDTFISPSTTSNPINNNDDQKQIGIKEKKEIQPIESITSPISLTNQLVTESSTSPSSSSTTSPELLLSSSSMIWPISIRLSSLLSKDVIIDLPINEPFWKIKDLKQQLMPHIESFMDNTSSSSIKKSSTTFIMKKSLSTLSSSSSSNNNQFRIVFIRLGKILDDQLLIIPSSSSFNDKNNNVLILEKDSVIQAMVSKS